MSRARTCFNRAVPASAGRATRPAVPGPGGAESWYRITNSADEGGSPVASISIYGDIGSWGITAASFVDELKYIDAPEIRLSINSPGGEVYDGLAIHNALRSHRARVIVQIDALAASIASVIAMAGDRVIMSPHSQLMIHDASTVIQGSPEELREAADFLDRQSDNIAAVYQERAGGTVKQWRSRMVAETWYFADEAVAAGLADEVAKPKRCAEEEEDEDMPGMDRALAASWDLTVYNYAHASRADAPPPALDAAAPTHHTATVDSPWDGSVQERRLPSPMTVAAAKKAYGWYDPAQADNGELPKSACKFPHHEVDGDGTPGAANLAACRNGLARLPQSDIPEAQRAAVEAHLRAHLADGGSGEEDRSDGAPTAFATGGIVTSTAIAMIGEQPVCFDPSAFRAATVAALDPMPGYEPGHFRSLMAGVAGDAPAAPAPVRADAVYVPPPADVTPAAEPQRVAVDYWHSLFTAAANDAPAAPATARAAPAVPEPQVVYVPEPPPPAGQVVAEYLRAVMTGVANNAPAPDQPAAPTPGAPDPVPAVDQAAFNRALWEASI